jgi:flagellar hook-associated protein 3 FlgL
MVFITTQSVSAEILRQQRMAQEIAGEQAKISTGKKINQASDNPHDWVQISQIGRRQSINAAWQGNLTFAESRATQASTNLSEINNLMTRVTELVVASTSTADGSPGREAVAKELEGIRSTISDLLNQTDYQGTPVFDHPNAVMIPLSAGLVAEAVPTRAGISENAVGTRSIDQVLQDTIAAVRTGTADDRSAALQDARTALDHVIVQQSIQGVRSQRLEDIGDRLKTSSLALKERRSTLEDTDVTETITKLQSKLLTLEASQLAFARISKKSLFDLF